MTEAVQATFIGGSRDLTRQALSGAPSVLRFPVLDGRRSMSVGLAEGALDPEDSPAFGYEEYRRGDWRSGYAGKEYVIYVFERRVFSGGDVRDVEIRRLRDAVASEIARRKAAEEARDALLMQIDRAKAALR